MNSSELINLLKELIEADFDAIAAYDRALEGVHDELICARLREFRDQHRSHVDLLSQAVRTLGGSVPEPSKDLKDHVVGAVATLRTATGEPGALKALRHAEVLVNRRYGKAMPEDIPPTLKDIVRKHLSDEKVHLDYIDNNI